MPAHARRQKQSGAVARLSSSRLPLGTPQVPSRSQTTSRATNRSNSAASSHITTASDNENTTKLLSGNAADMPHPAQAVMSTAEAKLQRQNERIKIAEDALANPPQPERSRPQSRAKSKPLSSLRPSDGSANPGRSRATSSSDGGIPIEIRVNSYRTEGALPPRSYTSVSQDGFNATTTGATPMARHDSVQDDVGFQTYTGRRNSRKGELGAYEDKPEVKQTTVEATVDQREILNVFANPLPGLEFLTGQAGWRNGQVQFIQHPNGDVSAHMWTPRNYQWDNIGHFSNIRKKIEGQLAGDHLKGETAYQKLQQNTLAYFRTIAKQREAAITGLDFGQTEIQQLLPEPGQTKQSVSSSKKLSASTPAFAVDTPKPYDGNSVQQQRILPQPAEPMATRSFFAVPQGPRVVEIRPQPPLSPKMVRNVEDPFIASAYGRTFAQLGPEYNGGTVAGPAKQPTSSMGPPSSVETRRSAYGAYNPTLMPAVPDIGRPYKPLPASRNPSSSEDVSGSFGSHFYTRSSMPSLLPARVAGTGPGVDRRHQSVNSLESLRGKPVTPLQAREAMRNNLFKISDLAVERSLSRENLQNMANAPAEPQPPRHSVLHDPFQAEDNESYDDYTSQSISRRSESESHISVPQVAPRTMTYRNSGMPFGWIDSQPRKNVPLPFESPLTNSVPDLIDDSDYLPPIVQAQEPYSFNNDPRTAYSLQNSVKMPGITTDEQLKDWWTSGSRFARQEEFYQRIQALSQPIKANEIGGTSTVANPRRPTVTKAASPTAGDMLTRVLIPVYENLSSYVEGPAAGRRDYWSRWTQAPEWCIDRGPNGNKSFYEEEWRAPAPFGRDSRYGSMDYGMIPPEMERRLAYTQY